MKNKYDFLKEFKKLSIDEKLELLPKDSQLAIGVIYSAVKDGDYQFFDTDWGINLVELANATTSIPVHKLREIALENFNKTYNDIFTM